MSNSSLVNYTKLSPNNSGKRTHTIDRITPHCVVGQCSVQSLGSMFARSSRGASCNYAIGGDGRVALIVDEGSRSWCSSSNANDQRAVTIECASEPTSPYAFRDVVYNKLIDLCVDICKRNGKTKLLWLGDKNTTLNYNPKSDEMVLTVHRWFANKACPGDWLMARMNDLASKVTARLGGSVTTPSVASTASVSGSTVIKVQTPTLAIYKTPNGASTGRCTGKGSFTITEVQGQWGKLKSGAGWINLSNASEVTVPGVNPSAASTLVATKKSTDEIAREVIAGKWGSGAARKANLEAAGYDYATVQNAVNSIVSGKKPASTTSAPTSAPAPTPQPARKSVNQIAQEVIAGKWGSGNQRKTNLQNTGYNYTEVQNAVNAILGGKATATPARKSNTEIAREVIAGKWGSGATRKAKLQAAGYNYAAIQAEVNRLL